MKITLLLLTFSLVLCVVLSSGCGPDNAGKPEPIKKNDYTTEPGGANRTK